MASFMTALFTTPVLVGFAICTAAAMFTTLGGFAIFRATKDNARLLAFGLAFAGGAMVYVSFVEIYAKSLMAFSEVLPDKQAYSYASLSFFAGVLMIAMIDRLIPNPHNELVKPGESVDKKQLRRLGLMAAIAITAHNFPEGMATFFATMEDPVVGSSLAFAIAVHNIPEGVSIAIPVYYATQSKQLTFLACFLSGMAEPVGALIGYLVLSQFLTPVVFGSVFGIIAGAMVFLSLDELLPMAKRYASGHDAVYGMVIGMGVMAVSLILFR